jgi:hypothetical protein
MSKRIFISYKRNTALDQPLAKRLHEALCRAGHDVFMDVEILLGEDWVMRIQHEVETADFLILLLSEQSIESQMVAEEVRLAERARKASGKPAILPVRVLYEGSLPYDLGAILNRLNYALWRSPADDDELLVQLSAALGGDALPAPLLAGGELPCDRPMPAANPRAVLELPEQVLEAASPFYIERDGDRVLAAEQTQPGYTLTIQAPRQTGKSSMLGRVLERGVQAGKKAAFIDFQGFEDAVLNDPAQLYYQFAFSIEDALQLEPQLDKYWGVPLGATQKCGRFMERRILPACGDGGLLLLLDDADELLASAASMDFFGMLRSWHSSRARPGPWKNFALAMAISTEPALLIADLTQSPFNVGTPVKLSDFELADTEKINQSHGAQLNRPQLETLYQLLGGHPYLTRKAFYLIGTGRSSFDALIAEACSETGPFGDHLRALLTRLILKADLGSAIRSALSGDRLDGRARERLIAGGLFVEQGGRLAARNQLYDRYLRRALHD